MRGRSRKKQKNTMRKPLILLTSLALVLSVTVGTALAYLIDTTQEVTNTFLPAEVHVSIVETMNAEAAVKEDVYIKNSSDETKGVDAYIRAKVVITWQDEQGNVSAMKPDETTDYKMTMGTDFDTIWFIGTDGFYYHRLAVAPTDKTSELISAIQQQQSKDGYNLHVEIMAEAIQATPEDAVEGAWKIVDAYQDAETGMYMIKMKD